jgi:hypothetical protein
MALSGLEPAMILNESKNINSQPWNVSKFVAELAKIEYTEVEFFDLLKSSKKFANCYEKCEVVEVSF